MLHYLPGCDVYKNHPQAITKMKEYMVNQGAFIDKCCRNKEDFLKDGDIIVNNCTLCQIILEERHTGEILSLYEYVIKDESFPWVNHHQEKITIQDCFRTRHNQKLQDAIRTCLKKMNFTVIETDEHHENTRYCGVWLNNTPSKDCIDVAPKTMNELIEKHIHILTPEQQVQKMKDWVLQYTTEKVVVYCNGCEKGLKLGGGNPVHIIELLAEGL